MTLICLQETDRATSDNAQHVKIHIQTTIAQLFMRALEAEARAHGFLTSLVVSATSASSSGIVLSVWRAERKDECKAFVLTIDSRGEKMVVLEDDEAQEAAQNGMWGLHDDFEGADWCDLPGTAWRDKLRRVLML